MCGGRATESLDARGLLRKKSRALSITWLGCWRLQRGGGYFKGSKNQGDLRSIPERSLTP